jgi:hypothetical protein
LRKKPLNNDPLGSLRPFRCPEQYAISFKNFRSHEKVEFRSHDHNFDLMKKLNFDLMRFGFLTPTLLKSEKKWLDRKRNHFEDREDWIQICNHVKEINLLWCLIIRICKCLSKKIFYRNVIMFNKSLIMFKKENSQ